VPAKASCVDTLFQHPSYHTLYREIRKRAEARIQLGSCFGKGKEEQATRTTGRHLPVSGGARRPLRAREEGL